MINRIIFACLAALIFATSAHAVILRWQPPQRGAIQGFRIYVDRSEVATIAADQLEYDLGELAEGETHIYGVTSFNSNGESQPAELQFTYEPTQTIVFPNQPRTLTLIFNESASQ